ncbi:hypothetical protein Tco_0052095 [Tanacetum coccineum]
MSGSEPGEMAPESSQVVVMPKFNMHVYTSTLTTKELKEAIMEYCIPTHLHPRLPPPELTMDKLPPKYIRIYMEQLEQGGLRIPFSTFFLTVIKHFGEHVSQLVPMGVIRVILFEIHYQSLNINATVSLFRCTMDDFLKLPVWNRTFVSKGDLILDDQRPPLCTTSPLEVGKLILEKNPTQRSVEKSNSKIVAAREKKDQQNLVKAQAKRAGERGSIAPRKKRARRNQELISSGSEGTISVTPPYQASPKPIDKTNTSVPKDTTGSAAIGHQTANPSGHVEHDDTQENVVFSNAYSIHSGYEEGNDEDFVAHRFVSSWGLCNNLRICSFRAYKELVSHLATPAEYEFLSGLSNIEVVRRAYQSLDRGVLSLGGDPGKWWVIEEACFVRECSFRVENIKKLEEVIEPKSQRLVDAEGRIQVLENEKTILHTTVEYRKSLAVPIGLCFTAGWLGVLSPGKKQEEIAAMLSETSDLDIEGSKVWKDRQHELFTKQYPYVQKVVDSYCLPVDALMNISPTVPVPTNNQVGTSAQNIDGGLTNPNIEYAHLAKALMSRLSYVFLFFVVMNNGDLVRQCSVMNDVMQFVLTLVCVRYFMSLITCLFVQTSDYRTLVTLRPLVYLIQVGMPISAEMTASLPYVKLKGVSPLLVFSMVCMSGPSGRGPRISRPHWQYGYEDMMDVKCVFRSLGTGACFWHESHFSISSLASDDYVYHFILVYVLNEQVGLAGDLGSTNDVLIPLEIQEDYRSRFNENAKFELGDEFLKILRDNAFNGKNGEDVVNHTRKVLAVLELIKTPNVDPNQLRLHVFPLSLTGDTRKWWINEEKNALWDLWIKGGGDEVLIDDVVSSDDEWKESDYANHLNHNSDPFFKPFFDA